MGQGLGLVGRLEPSGFNSDANSSSFYSNNTSTISNNLSNSRYLINRRENHIGINGNNGKSVGSMHTSQIGKVLPKNSQLISIEQEGKGYGSQTSNFNPVNSSNYNTN